MKKIALPLLWALTTFLLVMVTTLPANTNTQIVLGFILVLIVIGLKTLPLRGTIRLITISFALVIIFRYIYWRTTETIPPVTDLTSFIPGIILYTAEMYTFMMLLLSVFVVARPMKPRSAPAFTDEEAPTVDIFIPSYNEEADLLAATIAGAKRLDYPKDKLNIWLLDDGGTTQKRQSKDAKAAQAAQERHDSLQALCKEYGIHYLTRDKNVSAKAGNLNNGLEFSNGQLVAVFDADHIPAPHFLRETVGYYLKEEKLFLVQTPHFFRNADPIERNLQLSGKTPNENDMFYRVIQMGLDRWDGSFFCGSAALISRQALLESNGFAGKSITEDCESAVALHAKGWSSRYVEKVLITGLQPETMSSLIVQRSRWAQGMLQILLLNRPFLKKGLKLPQRFCYMSSTLFWLFPFPRLTFLIVPFFYLLFDLQIFIASGIDFFAYTISYMAMNLLLQNLLFSHVRRPWLSEVYEFVLSPHLAMALLSVLRNPLKPTFKVTSKSENVDSTHLSDFWPYFLGLFLLTFLGIAISGYRFYLGTSDTGVLLVVTVWNLLNFILAGCALGTMVERPEKQKQFDTNVDGTLTWEGHSTPCTMTNVSETELEIACEELTSDASPTQLTIQQGDAVHFASADGELSLNATVVEQKQQQFAGSSTIEVKPAQDKATIKSMTTLLFSDPEMWRNYDKKKAPVGVLMGTINFVLLGIRGIVNFFSFFIFNSRKSKPQASD